MMLAGKSVQGKETEASSRDCHLWLTTLGWRAAIPCEYNIDTRYLEWVNFLHQSLHCKPSTYSLPEDSFFACIRVFCFTSPKDMIILDVSPLGMYAS